MVSAMKRISRGEGDNLICSPMRSIHKVLDMDSMAFVYALLKLQFKGKGRL